MFQILITNTKQQIEETQETQRAETEEDPRHGENVKIREKQTQLWKNTENNYIRVFRNHKSKTKME